MEPASHGAQDLASSSCSGAVRPASAAAGTHALPVSLVQAVTAAAPHSVPTAPPRPRQLAARWWYYTHALFGPLAR